VRKGDDLTTFIVPKVEDDPKALTSGTPRATSELWRKTFTFTFLPKKRAAWNILKLFFPLPDK
jgi:hypothetical protein